MTSPLFYASTDEQKDELIAELEQRVTALEELVPFTKALRDVLVNLAKGPMRAMIPPEYLSVILAHDPTKEES